jgi:hypothetical protein
LAAFNLVCVFFVLPYIYVSRQGLRDKINHLGKAGLAVSAIVEGRSRVSCGDITCYDLAYRLTAVGPRGNIQYYAKVDVREDVYRALAGARFVNVRYLASEPRFSCLELDCTFSNSVVNEPIVEGFHVK